MVCESVSVFAPVPAAAAALTATNKHHDALRMFITVLSLKLSLGEFPQSIASHWRRQPT